MATKSGVPWVPPSARRRAEEARAYDAAIAAVREAFGPEAAKAIHDRAKLAQNARDSGPLAGLRMILGNLAHLLRTVEANVTIAEEKAKANERERVSKQGTGSRS